jgi:hypothetical protein
MNVNPFELFKNLQNLQSQLAETQEKLGRVTVTGSAGGEMVRIELNGRLEVLKVSIAPEAVDAGQIAMLEDLVLAAFTDGMAKVREKIGEQMSGAAGAFGLPPGMTGS